MEKSYNQGIQNETTWKNRKDRKNMENIRIVTDSASDIKQDAYENVTVLPMRISFDEDEYLDGVTITNERFFEKLIECDTLPKTSLISPEVFEKEYKQAKKKNERLIVITLSSQLSGTYQSAVIAAEGYPETVAVVDSMNATTGEMILVQYARELLEQGHSFEEVVATLEAEKTKIHTLAVLDTLEYLKKGGRISKTVAFVGEMLNIKPVVTVKDGIVQMLGKARGSKNGNNFLIKEVENSSGIDMERPLCLGYTGLNDHMLQKYIKDSHALYENYPHELPICSVGATIGTHVGPNGIVFSFFGKRG